MKPMICTSRCGTRSRSSPASRSRGSVVAARVRLASTPSVPLASSPHAASRPYSASGQPEHVDPRARGDERHQQREDHERDLDHHPLHDVERRHLRGRDHRDQQREVDPEDREPVRRGRHHDQHEDEQRGHLEVRRRPVHRRVAVVVELVAVSGAHVSAARRAGHARRRRGEAFGIGGAAVVRDGGRVRRRAGRRLAGAAAPAPYEVDQTQRQREDRSDADDPGEASGGRSSSTPLTP